MINLHHLQHFLAIADNGSVRAAADALGLTQPAISKSLRVLESSLGVPLVQRGARGSTLTEFGNVLYARARLIGNEVERVTEELRRMAGEGPGRVALGTSATPSFLLLGPAIQDFRARNPDVRLNLVGGLPNLLLGRVADGSLDLAVGPRPVQPLPPQVRSVALVRTRSAIAVRRGHPWAGARSLRDFATAEWVLNTSAGHAESLLHAAFLALGLERPHTAVYADSLHAAYTLIAKADYVGIMPRDVLDDSFRMDAISLVEVSEFAPVDSIELFFHGRAPLSAAAGALAESLRRAAEKVRAPERADTP